MGVETNLIEKSGSWYSCNEERIAQGKENVGIFLWDNPQIAVDIKQTILEITLPSVAKKNSKNGK